MPVVTRSPCRRPRTRKGVGVPPGTHQTDRPGGGTAAGQVSRGGTTMTMTPDAPLGDDDMTTEG